MFQFPGLAFVPYVFRNKYLLVISASPKTLARRTGRRLIAVRDVLGVTEIEGGFPHSEIRGSKLVRSSPRHIAAYHVLHRLSAPRHSPNTLKALDRSHCRCSPLGSGAVPCGSSCIDSKRPLLLRMHPRAPRSSRAHKLVTPIVTPSQGDESRMHFLFTMSDNPPRRCASRQTHIPGRKPAIAPSGGARRDRTDDLMLAKHALSQLSYGPDQAA